MEFLGIGPLELLFIILIALIILGPKDMVKAGKTLGHLLRRLVTSPTWRTVQDASRELRHLPNRLMREAGLEDLQKELPKAETIRQELGIDELKPGLDEISNDLSDWTTPPRTIGTPPHLPGEQPPAQPAAPAPAVEEPPAGEQPKPPAE